MKAFKSALLNHYAWCYLMFFVGLDIFLYDQGYPIFSMSEMLIFVLVIYLSMVLYYLVKQWKEKVVKENVELNKKQELEHASLERQRELVGKLDELKKEKLHIQENMKDSPEKNERMSQLLEDMEALYKEVEVEIKKRDSKTESP